ncbi:MAG TPA: DMT family transporter [Alphaproteobacteria bacterium]
MTPTVVGLVLCAAILHASWNAILRRSADRLLAVTVMSFATTAVAIPVALFLPLPLPASWPNLCLSALLQVGYSVFLVIAYRHAELGQVYPIVRGCVPLLVTLGAALFAHERLGIQALAGIVLVSLGIMSLALGKRGANAASVAAALATGFIIASYTVTDGVGASLAGSPYAYSTWLFLLYGILMPLTFRAMGRRIAIELRSPEILKALAAGIVQLLTYGVVIWAFTLSPIGPVSALRETSIVFAAAIGRIFLGESFTIRRLVACIAISIGAICLGYRF